MKKIEIEEQAITIDELIAQLEELKQQYGNIKVLGLSENMVSFPIDFAIESVINGIGYITPFGDEF